LIGYALGGEAGARFAIDLSMTTRPDTLLTCLEKDKHDSTPLPRFVRIDFWTWGKRDLHGTFVVNQERGLSLQLNLHIQAVIGPTVAPIASEAI
jgi:hypothetical protein